MAEKLHFSLVSPEREVYVGEVDQVDAPGSEGDFGVLAGHAPFMTALREGFVTVHEGEHLHRFEVQGGFVPNVVGHGVGAITEARDCLGESESSAFRVGEVRCVAPGRHGEQPLFALARLLQQPRVHVDA